VSPLSSPVPEAYFPTVVTENDPQRQRRCEPVPRRVRSAIRLPATGKSVVPLLEPTQPDSASMQLIRHDLEMARIMGARHDDLTEGQIVRHALRTLYLIDEEQLAGGIFRLQDKGVAAGDAERIMFRTELFPDAR